MTDPAAETAVAVKASKQKLGAVGWVCAAWLILLVLVSLFGGLLKATPIEEGSRALRACGDGSGLPIYDPLGCRDTKAAREQRDSGRAEGKVRHLAGVDDAGRDVFSMVFLGTRTTITIAVVSIAGATLLGGLLGMLSGYFRGRVDTVVSILLDVMIAFPPLVLAMLLVFSYSAGAPERRVRAIMIAVTVVATPILGRIARVSAMSWSQREFVMAAKALGARPHRIILREVLPNVVPAMMSIALLAVGIAIVTEAGLSIIGMGVGGDDVSWGAVIAAGADSFRKMPHLVFVPTVPIVVTVCALNLLGDALRRKFNVRESAL
ncbi:MAG: ABC transporter permease [Microthrixaceae bacterium]|nr:ABC transporter permease [Microthrixaceae bacterium]MCO5312852.1 ABC transporter permease [Microthrixaceae bacterium]